jgi:GABA(A) receptor-associated protein
MERYTMEQRIDECQRIMNKFPDRIPIIVKKASKAADAPDLDKNKFLAPKAMTVGQFLYVVRRRMNLPPEKALFIFVENTLPTTATLISDLYYNHRARDGFLYMQYSSESTFG